MISLRTDCKVSFYCHITPCWRFLFIFRIFMIWTMMTVVVMIVMMIRMVSWFFFSLAWCTTLHCWQIWHSWHFKFWEIKRRSSNITRSSRWLILIRSFCFVGAFLSRIRIITACAGLSILLFHFLCPGERVFS